jgi:hypothetical protein
MLAVYKSKKEVQGRHGFERDFCLYVLKTLASSGNYVKFILDVVFACLCSAYNVRKFMYVHVRTEKSSSRHVYTRGVDSTRLLSVEKNISPGMRLLRRAVYPRAVRTFNFLSPTTFLSLPIR